MEVIFVRPQHRRRLCVLRCALLLVSFALLTQQTQPLNSPHRTFDAAAYREAWPLPTEAKKGGAQPPVGADDDDDRLLREWKQSSRELLYSSSHKPNALSSNVNHQRHSSPPAATLLKTSNVHAASSSSLHPSKPTPVVIGTHDEDDEWVAAGESPQNERAILQQQHHARSEALNKTRSPQQQAIKIRLPASVWWRGVVAKSAAAARARAQADIIDRRREPTHDDDDADEFDAADDRLWAAPPIPASDRWTPQSMEADDEGGDEEASAIERRGEQQSLGRVNSMSARRQNAFSAVEKQHPSKPRKKGAIRPQSAKWRLPNAVVTNRGNLEHKKDLFSTAISQTRLKSEKEQQQKHVLRSSAALENGGGSSLLRLASLPPFSQQSQHATSSNKQQQRVQQQHGVNANSDDAFSSTAAAASASLATHQPPMIHPALVNGRPPVFAAANNNAAIGSQRFSPALAAASKNQIATLDAFDAGDERRFAAVQNPGFGSSSQQQLFADLIPKQVRAGSDPLFAGASPFDALMHPPAGMATPGIDALQNSLPQLGHLAQAFGFLPSSAGGGDAFAGAAAHHPPLNPLQLLSQSGTTLEQITNMAKNLIQMGQQGGAGGGSNSELFAALTKMVSGGGAVDPSKYTSSAVSAAAASEPSDPQQPSLHLKTSLKTGDPTSAATANSSSSTPPLLNDTLTTLHNLEPEQRSLLEAAMNNGELDKSAALFLEKETRNVTTTSESSNVGINSSINNANSSTQNAQRNKPPTTRLVNAETRLIEWIQQNRPRNADATGAAGGGGGLWGYASSTPGGSVASSRSMNIPERFPYYGRYCGSFVEQQSENRRQSHGIAGAVWAVDGRRLLIPNFQYTPGPFAENVTFWVGPARLLPGAMQRDGGGGTFLFYPNEETGVYLRPEHIDPQAFSIARLHQHRVVARNRFPLANTTTIASQAASSQLQQQLLFPPAVASLQWEATTTASPETDEGVQRNISLRNNDTARDTPQRQQQQQQIGDDEGEEEDDRTIFNEDDASIAPMSVAAAAPHQLFFDADNEVRRRKMRSAKRETKFSLQQNPLQPQQQKPQPLSSSATAFHLTASPTAGGVITATPQQGRQEHDDDAPSDRQNPSIGSNTSSSDLFTDFVRKTEILPQHRTQSSAGANDRRENDHPPTVESLRWYAGLQPILLTLPEGIRSVPALSWLSVFDHRTRQPLATVAIPSPPFQVPSLVQLRPLTPKAGFQIRSGPLQIIDTRTAELQEFALVTEGRPVWFMIGREVAPNANGHIVPIFDREMMTFDCESLRDYRSETVTLRLPGSLEWTDVFWFAVFSIHQQTAWAHLYVPYRDLQVPPSLSPILAPQCIYSPNTPANDSTSATTARSDLGQPTTTTTTDTPSSASSSSKT